MNYLIFVVAVVVATAVLLGLLWWYSTRPLYPEADAYAKKHCSDEQALARASEEAWQQARVGKDRTMGPLVVGNWPPKSLYERVAALEEEMGTDDPTRWTLRDRIVGLEQQIGVLQGAATPSPPTASPTTDRSWAVAEQDYTPRLSPASWPSDQQIMDAGPVARVYESAEE